MIPHYGPVSYYELGRVYPRDELRRPFDRQRYRRTLGGALIPSAPPSVAPPAFQPDMRHAWYGMDRGDTWPGEARDATWFAAGD